MKSQHHEDVTRVAASLAGVPADAAALMAHGSSAPDYLQDVSCSVLGGETQFPSLGNITSLQHSQRPGNRGYCWRDDASMGAAGLLGDLAMPVTRMIVMGTSMPMLRAIHAQPGVTFDRFVFPSAADCGAFYQQVANGDPGLMGMALHMVQDCCIPFHPWGVCWWGHSEWEVTCEALWLDHRKRLKQSGDGSPLIEAVRAEVVDGGSLQEICEENASWAGRWFGKPRNMPECLDKDMLAVSVRAIAAAMKAIHIMRKAQS